MNKAQRIDSYRTLIPTLEDERRHQFYHTLMHDLTIVGRAVQRYDHLDTGEKLLFCLALNEVQHALTSKQLSHLMGGADWCDHDFMDKLEKVIRNCPELENSLTFAVRHSYKLSTPHHWLD